MIPVGSAANVFETSFGQGLTSATGATSSSSSTDSGNIFSDALHAAQQGIQAADTKAQNAVTGLLTGNGVEVHDAMIATQESEITLELALQVRNKAVAAYQQMMQMQF